MPDAIDKILAELGLDTPEARQRIVAGFARRTQLTPEQEVRFRKDALAMGHPERALDDPTYDMRAAWLAGQLKPAGQHGSSEFKGLGDERLFLPIGAQGQVLDTRTARPDAHGAWTGPTPNPELLNLWRAISTVMNRR